MPPIPRSPSLRDRLVARWRRVPGLPRGLGLRALLGFIAAVLIAGHFLWSGPDGLWRADLPGRVANVLDILYRSALHFAFEPSAPEPGASIGLALGRLLAMGVVGYTVFRAFQASMDHERRRRTAGRLHGHAVILGAGRRGMAALAGLRGKHPKLKIVLVDLDAGSLAAAVKSKDVIALQDDGCQEAALAAASVAWAAYVIAAMPSDEENLRAVLAATAMSRMGSKAQFRAVVRDDAYQSALENRARALSVAGPDVRTAYPQKTAALEIAIKFGPDAFRPILHGDDPTPHVAVLGMGASGFQLLKHGLLLWHTAAAKPPQPAFRVDLYDSEADAAWARLVGDLPGAATIADAHPHQADLWSWSPRELVKNAAPDRPLDAVYICVGDPTLVMTLVNRLQRVLPEITEEQGFPPGIVIVRSRPAPSLPLHLNIEQLVNFEYDVYSRALSYENLFELDSARTNAGQALHGAYTGAQPSAQRSPAALDWNQLTTEFRYSNLLRAEHAALQFRSLGLTARRTDDPLSRCSWAEAIANPDDYFGTHPRGEQIAAVEHARWYAERVLHGWRHADRRDDVRRSNPVLRPWHGLDDDSRERNQADASKSFAPILQHRGLTLYRYSVPWDRVFAWSSALSMASPDLYIHTASDGRNSADAITKMGPVLTVMIVADDFDAAALVLAAASLLHYPRGSQGTVRLRLVVVSPRKVPVAKLARLAVPTLGHAAKVEDVRVADDDLTFDTLQDIVRERAVDIAYIATDRVLHEKQLYALQAQSDDISRLPVVRLGCDDNGTPRILGSTPPSRLAERWSALADDWPSLCQRMAASAHNRYLDNGNKDKSWDDLDELKKFANYGQIDHLPIKARYLGLHIVPIAGNEHRADAAALLKARLDKPADADRLWTLARTEHRRWEANRLVAGYRWGAQRADRAEEKAMQTNDLRHPSLVHWGRLDEPTRRKDLDTIVAMGGHLQGSGYKLVETSD